MLGDLSPFENLRRATQGSHRRLDARRPLMRPDDEITVRRKAIHDAPQHKTLQRFREIGERDVATKNEIERTCWSSSPQVLMQEFNPLPMFRLDAVEGSSPIECLPNQLWRQFAEAGWLKTPSSRPCQHGVIDIGRR